jgi:DNA mismatch repair protein MutH
LVEGFTYGLVKVSLHIKVPSKLKQGWIWVAAGLELYLKLV